MPARPPARRDFVKGEREALGQGGEEVVIEVGIAA